MNATTRFEGRTYLITGIADAASLATAVAEALVSQGARVVCSGLGPTVHHEGLSERARQHLQSTFDSFQGVVADRMGSASEAQVCDLGIDASIRDLAQNLASRGLKLDGVLHSVARDRTIGRDGVQPLLEVSREDFLDALDVSAYSLIALLRELSRADALARGAGVVALSYLGAERVVAHPYKNVAVAKAALERIVIELADELGRSHGVRVNGVRFSPYTASRAGGAISGLAEAEALCDHHTALGNARPSDLAEEVVHLLRPGQAITGEIRNVDGGYRLLALGAGNSRSEPVADSSACGTIPAPAPLPETRPDGSLQDAAAEQPGVDSAAA